MTAGSKDDARRLAREARALRIALDEVARGGTAKRRRIVLLLAVGIVFGAQLVDAHSETCGPFARRHLVRVDGAREFVCDLTFPLHAHGAGSWASDANLLGLVAYGALGGAGIRWYKRALREPGP